MAPPLGPTRSPELVVAPPGLHDDNGSMTRRLRIIFAVAAPIATVPLYWAFVRTVEEVVADPGRAFPLVALVLLIGVAAFELWLWRAYFATEGGQPKPEARRILLGIGAALLVGGWGTTRYAVEHMNSQISTEGWKESFAIAFDPYVVWRAEVRGIYAAGVVGMALGAGMLAFAIPRGDPGKQSA